MGTELSSVNKDTKYVFVYGTLKKGFGANGMMDDGIFLGDAETPPVFRMFGTAFPWIIFDEENGKSVHGELYAMPRIDHLDRYEGVPTFYNRQEINVRPLKEFKFFGKESVSAWIYFRKPGAGVKIHEVAPNKAGVLTFIG